MVRLSVVGVPDPFPLSFAVWGMGNLLRNYSILESYGSEYLLSNMMRGACYGTTSGSLFISSFLHNEVC